MAIPHGPAAQDDDALLAWLLAEARHPFTGWDFSYLDGRMRDEPTAWDYPRVVRTALDGCAALLDMGTGGGEFLASFAPLPALTAATEGYPPNLPVARARLTPLGVMVEPIAEDGHSPLPFADEAFDLVINRHEYYDPREVWRVLRPGGRFITQQVGGENDRDLNRLLESPNPGDGFAFWTLAHARAELAAADFAIATAAEAFPTRRFADVGAIVYYLGAVPWQIPDFDVARYLPRLREAQRQIERAGGILIRQHRFILVAEKRPAQAA